MNPISQLFQALANAGKQDDVNFLSIIIDVSHAERQGLDALKEKYQHDTVISRRIEEIELQMSTAVDALKQTLLETTEAVVAVLKDPTDEKVAGFTGISAANRGKVTAEFADVSVRIHALLAELKAAQPEQAEMELPVDPYQPELPGTG
jgi:nucleoside-triphosphatase THEP1